MKSSTNTTRARAKLNRDNEKYRRELFDIWNRLKRGEPLEGTEKIIGELMLQHEEFLDTWQHADAYAKINFPADMVDPFLHISADAVVVDEIQRGDPPSTRRTYERLRNLGADHLEAIHCIVWEWVKERWRSSQEGTEFNARRFARRLHYMLREIE